MKRRVRGAARHVAVLAAALFVSAMQALAQPASAAGASTPATVVLLHGLGRSKSAMWRLENRLEGAGFKVESIGYRSLSQSPAQIIEAVERQIRACCGAVDGKLHFVGHSLGGLLIRAYLQRHDVPELGRVVLIGTPNQGTEIVDRFRDRWWMRLAGPTARALGTNDDSLPSSLAPPYYPVGVIAGVTGSGRNDAVLPGDDDGLVSVEATKLEGMTDFVVVDSGHSLMRYSDEVANQTIMFLRQGRFSH
ncbi:MAG: alpha/beta fold hydrolase [Burkholderiaceae bacterium]